MQTETLRTMVDFRDLVIQKNRMAFGARLGAIERGDDDADRETIAWLNQWYDRFADYEVEVDLQIREIAEQTDIILTMTDIRGVGLLLAAKIVAMVDISRSPTVSSFWRYCGYGINSDGERDRPTKGEALKYNARLKKTLYVVAGSFMKSNSPYRRIYDNAREYYSINRPDWSKGHQHAAARRKMIKLFLSHLWEVWRKMEGLPTRELYVVEHMGHQHVIAPQEFGWPEV